MLIRYARGLVVVLILVAILAGTVATMIQPLP